jgi:hypothetical protein
MLALRPGQLVTSSQLIDGLWGEQPPSEPGNALQALVSRLRRALPEAEIESRPAGYQLVLDPEATDIARFERLAAQGRTQLRDEPAQAARTLRAALALWRGPALADITDVAGLGLEGASGGFSVPVRVSSTDAYWPVSPMSLRTWCGSRTTSWPSTLAVPASGVSNVARMRTAVVLPAPFGPSSPNTVPVRTARLTPSSARVSPNRLTRPSASME